MSARGLGLYAVMLAGVALAACSNAPDEEAGLYGPGAAGAPLESGDPGATGLGPLGSVASSQLPPGVVPGSQEDLEYSVGDTVLFGFDSTVVPSSGQTTLQGQAAWLQQYPQVDVTIEGHADERGTREYNLALGERRATAVKNYLAALGVEPNRMLTVSYGEERPADAGTTDEAYARNRRAKTAINRLN